MISKIKDAIRNVFNSDEKEKDEQSRKTAYLQQKTNNVLANNEYNPFVDKDGKIINPMLNYQKLLDNPNVSQKAKEYISAATGLVQSSNVAKKVVAKNDTANSTSQSSVSNSYNGQSFHNNGVGFISAKYESGGDGGRVSSGEGDAGGVSYGVSQFSSKTGSADSFISWLKKNNPTMASAFKNHKAGTTEFSNAWKQTFSQYGDDFTKIQRQYTYDNFVMPLANLAKEKTGVDYTRSTALKELLYSTAIQFGGSSLGLSALGNVNANMSDKDIINASYDKKISNYKNYFSSSSTAVQESVKDRFARERQDVLNLIGMDNAWKAGNTIKQSTVGQTVNK